MDQITSAQLSEWEAYDRLDPIGTWREDFRFAVLEALLVNIVNKLYPKKGHPAKEILPMEFMPNWNGEKKEAPKQSVEEMKSILLSIASSANKKLEIEKKREESAKIPPRTKPTKRPQINNQGNV